jgi:hypothetical protein
MSLAAVLIVSADLGLRGFAPNSWIILAAAVWGVAAGLCAVMAGGVVLLTERLRPSLRRDLAASVATGLGLALAPAAITSQIIYTMTLVRTRSMEEAVSAVASWLLPGRGTTCFQPFVFEQWLLLAIPFVPFAFFAHRRTKGRVAWHVGVSIALASPILVEFARHSDTSRNMLFFVGTVIAEAALLSLSAERSWSWRTWICGGLLVLGIPVACDGVAALKTHLDYEATREDKWRETAEATTALPGSSLHARFFAGNYGHWVVQAYEALEIDEHPGGPPESRDGVRFPGDILRRNRRVHALRVHPGGNLFALEMSSADSSCRETVWGFIDLRGLGFELGRLARHDASDAAQRELARVSAAVAIRYREAPSRLGWQGYLAASPEPRAIAFEWYKDWHDPFFSMGPWLLEDPSSLQTVFTDATGLGEVASVLARRHASEVRRVEDVAHLVTAVTALGEVQLGEVAREVGDISSRRIWLLQGEGYNVESLDYGIVSTDPRAVVVIRHVLVWGGVFADGPLVVDDPQGGCCGPMLSRGSLYAWGAPQFTVAAPPGMLHVFPR